MNNTRELLGMPSESVLRIQDCFLSERQVLALNELFLTPGFHDLQVGSVALGRGIMWPYVSLIHATKIAVVSMDFHSSGAYEFVVNLYEHMAMSKLFDEQGMTDFLLNDFAYDFMWIEWSHELATQPWFGLFKRKLVELSLHQELPILILYPTRCKD